MDLLSRDSSFEGVKQVVTNTYSLAASDGLPLASTRQFRNAVRTVLSKDRFHTLNYTDTPPTVNGSREHSKRYVMMGVQYITPEEVRGVEFILWCQGVTAKTRIGFVCVRGTCVMVK